MIVCEGGEFLCSNSRTSPVGSVLHPPALITSPDNDDTSTPNPFLYVNLASIQSLNAEMLAEGNEKGSDLIVKAFVSLTEVSFLA